MFATKRLVCTYSADEDDDAEETEGRKCYLLCPFYPLSTYNYFLGKSYPYESKEREKKLFYSLQWKEVHDDVIIIIVVAIYFSRHIYRTWLLFDCCSTMQRKIHRWSNSYLMKEISSSPNELEQVKNDSKGKNPNLIISLSYN